ncbi:MAG: hypothetical protein QOI65_2266 [Thermoleophilaceae bacterium]|nr:hypothetical protein [Thermoleophilaceae bacterium]
MLETLVLRERVPPRLTSVIAAVGIVAAVAFSSGASQAAGPTVAVFPAAGTLVASPETQISFRGRAPSELTGIRVRGSQSGVHGGTLRAHSDGNGASFLPKRGFRRGERVTVTADFPMERQEHGSVKFRISRPPGHYHLGRSIDRGGNPPGTQHFVSRRDIRPPSVIVTRRSKATDREGDIFTAAKAGRGQDGTIVTDSHGRLVWFKEVPKHTSAFDFRVQRYRGNPVLTWWQGEARPGQGLGVGMMYDTSYHHIATVHAGNGYRADLHEFELSPRSTALVLGYQPVTFGGSIAMDTLVQEIDIPTGLVMFEWHSLGQISHKESYAPHNEGQPYDVAHVNSIEMVPDGGLLISARHTHAVYKLDHRTAQIRWRLGGRRSDFEMAPGSRFISQHHARLQPDGSITLFDNGGPPDPGRQARALWLNVNEAKRRVSVRRSYRYPHTLRSMSQGSMQVLPSHNVFVGWGGNSPKFSEFTSGGTMVFDAHFKPEGVDTYRAYRFQWHARPGRPPDVRAKLGGGHTGVYVSWNGSTDVAQWEVLAGDDPAVLLPAAKVSRKGFETHVKLDAERRYVRVRALGSSGQELGQSKTVRASG